MAGQRRKKTFAATEVNGLLRAHLQVPLPGQVEALQAAAAAAAAAAAQHATQLAAQPAAPLPPPPPPEQQGSGASPPAGARALETPATGTSTERSPSGQRPPGWSAADRGSSAEEDNVSPKRQRHAGLSKFEGPPAGSPGTANGAGRGLERGQASGGAGGPAWRRQETTGVPGGDRSAQQWRGEDGGAGREGWQGQPQWGGRNAGGGAAAPPTGPWPVRHADGSGGQPYDPFAQPQAAQQVYPAHPPGPPLPGPPAPHHHPVQLQAAAPPPQSAALHLAELIVAVSSQMQPQPQQALPMMPLGGFPPAGQFMPSGAPVGFPPQLYNLQAQQAQFQHQQPIGFAAQQHGHFGGPQQQALSGQFNANAAGVPQHLPWLAAAPGGFQQQAGPNGIQPLPLPHQLPHHQQPRPGQQMGPPPFQ